MRGLVIFFPRHDYADPVACQISDFKFQIYNLRNLKFGTRQAARAVHLLISQGSFSTCWKLPDTRSTWGYTLYVPCSKNEPQARQQFQRQYSAEELWLVRCVKGVTIGLSISHLPWIKFSTANASFNHEQTLRHATLSSTVNRSLGTLICTCYAAQPSTDSNPHSCANASDALSRSRAKKENRHT